MSISRNTLWKVTGKHGTVMHCPSFSVVSFAIFSGVLMAEIMRNFRDVSTHLVDNKMGRTDQLFLWNDGFMNAITTRIMRQRNQSQSDSPYLSISGMLHARIIYCMWLTWLFSVHVPCYIIICGTLPSKYMYLSLLIYSTTVLFVFFYPPPRFLLREAKFLPRCGEGPARRKAVKRPCDLDPIGFPVEVSETPWNQHNTWKNAILKGKSSERSLLFRCYVDVSGRVGVNYI